MNKQMRDKVQLNYFTMVVVATFVTAMVVDNG
jgi:hypothetical protein